MTEHMCRKHALENMSKAEVEAALSSVVLSEDERMVMEMIYLKRKPIGYIADVTGYSESGIKKIHCRVIKRMKNLR